MILLKQVLNHTEAEGNTEFVKSGKSFGKMEAHNLPDIKNYLSKNGISIRIAENIGV